LVIIPEQLQEQELIQPQLEREPVKMVKLLVKVMFLAILVEIQEEQDLNLLVLDH
jgi:hypothetical protein